MKPKTKSAFEYLQQELTMPNTPEFREKHIPEILEAMGKFSLQNCIEFYYFVNNKFNHSTNGKYYKKPVWEDIERGFDMNGYTLEELFSLFVDELGEGIYDKISLNKLEEKLDNALRSETPESLNEWLKQQNNNA